MEERSIPDKFRSSHLQMFFKIGGLKKLCKFRRKTPVLEPRFNKKRLQRRCFLVKFAKFLRTPFLQNTSGRCSRKLNYRKKITLNRLNIETRKFSILLSLSKRYLPVQIQ